MHKPNVIQKNLYNFVANKSQNIKKTFVLKMIYGNSKKK